MFFANQVICNLEEVVNTHISNLQLEIELEKLGHREALTHIEQTSKKVETNEQMDEFESKPIPTVLGKIFSLNLFLSIYLNLEEKTVYILEKKSNSLIKSDSIYILININKVTFFPLSYLFPKT